MIYRIAQVSLIAAIAAGVMFIYVSQQERVARRADSLRTSPTQANKRVALAAPTPHPPSPDPFAKVDDETLNLAALNRLYPIIGETLDNDNLTQRQIDQQREKIRCLREWAATVANVRARAEYESWLDHYAGEADKAEQRLRNGDARSDERLREEQWRAERRRIESAARLLPSPLKPCPLPAKAKQ